MKIPPIELQEKWMNAECSCVQTFIGNHLEPPEWEQDVFCPKHSVDFILLARIEELETALKDAISEWQDCLGYVPEYFRDKWHLQDEIEAAKKALGES